MKHVLLIGLALVTTNVWAQAPAETVRPLCAPFAPYAAEVLAFVERSEQTGLNASSSDALRRAVAAMTQCAESGTRLWSRAAADAQLTTVQKQFDVGLNTSVAVSAARVATAKASYCEAAFAHLTRQAEIYDRRKEAGLTGPQDIASVLTELEALVPVRGRRA